MLEAVGPAEATDPGLHLVEDEQGAALAAERLQALEVAFRRLDHAGLALDRLDENRAGAAVDLAGRRLQVAEGHRSEPSREGAEADLVGGRCGRRQGAQGTAVETALRGDDPVPVARAVAVVGVAPRQLDRGLDRLGAAVAEEGAVEQTLRGLHQQLARPLLFADPEEVRDVQVAPGLARDRLGQGRVAVAQGRNRDAGQEVEVLAAPDVPEAHSVAVAERHRRPLVVCEQAVLGHDRSTP